MDKKLFSICLIVSGKDVTTFASEIGVSVPTVYNALNNPERSSTTASKIASFIDAYRAEALALLEKAEEAA